MIILDRVFCDLCETPMGQLMAQSAQSPDLISDQSRPPEFAVCPDCLDAACAEVAA
ncbi:hypothetical protein [Pseudomonas sp. 2FE]|uniref:hypothetical protein n=1 Tax=Pseudomonas sp. 2FE TaxID=2502190 RepID=UPI0014856DB6|nr:hypothetical protein [Pseudomonas sp. 2FE]